ncbi:hypothetical protein Holit_02163 [Hollandina sp. SP2]
MQGNGWFLCRSVVRSCELNSDFDGLHKQGKQRIRAWIITAAIDKSVTDEDLLFAPYEAWLQGEWSVVEAIQWERDFEHVLREVEGEDDTIQYASETKQETEGLIFLEDVTKRSTVLSTQKPEIITHSSLGNIVRYAGEAKKRECGLKYIIFSRMTDNTYNKIDAQITAILALMGFALHDGKPEKSGDGFRITKNGIAVIVENRITRKGQTLFLLSGYDLVAQQKEATGAIQTVNAQYSYAPEYSELHKQVVAVTSTI